MRQGLGEPELHEFRPGNHDDRDRTGQGEHWQRVVDAGGDDDVGVCRDQLGGGDLAPLRVLTGDPAVDGEVASLDPAGRASFLGPLRAAWLWLKQTT